METFYRAIETIRKLETDPETVLALKGAEEFGEFAEAVLRECGYNSHKSTDDVGDSFSEGADVLVCLVAVLALIHKDESPKEIMSRLFESFGRGMRKYEKILNDNR